MKYYWFAHGEVASVRATVSRTGYTGEDGFEIFVPPQSADRVWQAMLEAGQPAERDPVRPRRARHAAARGGDAPARQRHRRDDDARSKRISDWIVGWKKDDFIGADALREQKAERRRAQARRLRDARPRHRAPRLRRLRRRREGRRRDERHADAVS